MRSIQRTFPLFVTALLLAVAILQLTIGYGEVRQASRSVADTRLRFVDSVLVDLFQSSQQRGRVTALAKDSAVTNNGNVRWMDLSIGTPRPRGPCASPLRW